MSLPIELRDFCAFDQHVCFFVLKKCPTAQECFQIGIIATTILRPLSRSSWPLRNIHFSNGKWSFPFFIYFVLSLVIDNILNYRTWQWVTQRCLVNFLPFTNNWVHPGFFLFGRVRLISSKCCVLFLFVLICILTPSVACVSGLSNLDCPLRFSKNCTTTVFINNF